MLPRRAEVEVELRVLDALALGGEQLDELGAAVLLARVRRPPRGRGRSRTSGLGHVHSFEVTGAAGSPHADWRVPSSDAGVVRSVIGTTTGSRTTYRGAAGRGQSAVTDAAAAA